MGIYPGEIHFSGGRTFCGTQGTARRIFFDRYLKQEGAATHDQ